MIHSRRRIKLRSKEESRITEPTIDHHPFRYTKAWSGFSRAGLSRLYLNSARPEVMDRVTKLCMRLKPGAKHIETRRTFMAYRGYCPTVVGEISFCPAVAV
jgi:hypothetical protein